METIINLKDENLNFGIWETILTGKLTFVSAGMYRGIVFEIRPKEQGHNVPHCHAHYSGNNISVSLVDFSILAGNIPPKQAKIASDWVKGNIDILKKYWNTYHKEVVA